MCTLRDLASKAVMDSAVPAIVLLTWLQAVASVCCSKHAVQRSLDGNEFPHSSLHELREYSKHRGRHIFLPPWVSTLGGGSRCCPSLQQAHR